MRRALSLLFAGTAIALFACSGDDGGASVSPEGACDDYASAICERIEACAPFYLKLGLSTRDQCMARFKINCPSVFTATGTSATPTRLAQCATDARSLSCDDVFGRNTPASCRFEPGELADGAACGTDAQCKNKLCRLPASNTCGACSTPGTAGAACERNEDCDAGLGCAQKKCVAFGKAGAKCDAATPCIATYSCVGGVCAIPLEAGATCTPSLNFSENPCNFLKGLFCHTKNNVCATVDLVAPGSPCGFINDTIVGCSAGDCKTDALGKGTCVAKAADGATCETETSGNGERLPKCQDPARCVSGVCKITDPAACK